MSAIKGTHIDGDVSIGRNVAMGGRARVAGSVSIGHNLRVDGWLEALNIKSVNKGVFLTLEDLQKAYPHPLDGWFAGVGSSTPFAAYVGNGGEWVATGGTIEVSLDLTGYTEIVEQLQEDIDAYILERIDAIGLVAYRCFIDQSKGGFLSPDEEEEITVTVINGCGKDVTDRFTLISVTRNTGDEASDALWNSQHTNVENPFIIKFSDLGIDGIRKTVATFYVTASDEGTGDVAKAATTTYFS